jgi:CSLREA domain-containing protein
MRISAALLAAVLIAPRSGLAAQDAPEASDAPIYTVNDLGDAGDAAPGNNVCATAAGKCTLRAAIDEANAHSGPESINLPPGVINLNSELRVLDKVGDDSLTINGAGQNATFLDGMGKARVFYLMGRSGAHTISNLTIQNGNNQNTSTYERYGGGIYNEAVLFMTNVTVKNSKALFGAGIFNQLAMSGPAGLNIPVLNMTNVLITGNTATGVEVMAGGAGLWNGSQLNATNVDIISNTAANQGGGYYNNSYHPSVLTNVHINNNTSRAGGGIDNDIGDITFTNGTINNNTVICCNLINGNPNGGGGIYNNDGSISLKSVTLTGNSVTASGGYGGAIFNYKNMNLINVAVTGNRASYGAGIYNGNYDGIANTLSMTNVTVSGNSGLDTATVQSMGGGIFNSDQGHAYLLNTTLSANYAYIGGGVLNRSTNTLLQLRNSILAGNTDRIGTADCQGVIASTGNNIVGKPDGGSGWVCTFQATGGDQLRVDPRLGALQGSPAYHPLLGGSPALDKASSSACPPYDIINTPRPMGSGCDIGSQEKVVSTTSGVPRLYLPIGKTR